jgi:peptidoglycan/xylan/chitin deacetylase (PgdA/CDA1 family)
MALIIPTLMYHSVELESNDYLTISRKSFYEHIAFLKKHYNMRSIEEIAVNTAQAKEIPANTVVISFDDSLRNNIDYTVPVLEEFDAPAIFFVIAGYIGQDNSWDHKAYRIEKHMNELELKELVTSGFSIGSHSLTHQRLPKLSDEDVKQEFIRSKTILEEITGKKPLAFSYPYGDADERCLTLCQQHFTYGFATVRKGEFDWSLANNHIRRIYVSPTDSPRDLDEKIRCYKKSIQHQ